jgi:hypothetical protein
MGLFGKREPKFPELLPIPAIADLPEARLQAAARYLGTVDAEGERVIGQGLSAKSAARLNLSSEALDVVRMAGSFRIPVGSLRGARADDRFQGKPVASLLVIAWQHGEHAWETGFRLEELKSIKKARGDKAGISPARAPRADEWVRTISKMARQNSGGNA